MSFQSSNALQKRDWNFLWYDGTPTSGIKLNSTFEAMNFAIAYQADFPGVTELGGTFNPASTGSNLTLSLGDFIVDFAGVGTTLSSVSMPAGTIAWEYEIIGLGAGTYSVGYVADNGAGIDVDSSPIIQVPAPAYDAYLSNGLFETNFGSGGDGPAWIAGDSIGFVFTPGSNTIFFYLNGVFLRNIGSVISGGFAFASQSA